MKTKWFLLALAGIFAVIQAFPINRNLPFTRPDEEFHRMENPGAEVMQLLKQACYDCHSNHTRYPWYARIQPLGWWMQDHILEGRQEMNFSEFGRWSAEDRADVLRHCAKLIEKGSMPLRSYLPMHPEARLSEAQKTMLLDWLKNRAGELETAGAAVMVHRKNPVVRDTCDDNDANPRCCFAGMPESPGSSVSVAPADEPGKRMVISGRILKKDGKTPYPNVLLYVYHANDKGIYARKGSETGIHRWHGHLHGWLRTDAQGRYEIRSIRPASYPDTKINTHIHAVVWEPGVHSEPYYIEDFLFADDPYLKPSEREVARKNPGKSHIVTLKANGVGVLEGKRDIIASLGH